MHSGSYAAQANDRATQQMGRDRAPASRGDGILRAGIQNTMAVRTHDHALIALNLVGELRRDAHVAPLARAPTYFDNGKTSPPHENRFVLAAQIRIDGRRQLLTPLSRFIEPRRQRHELRVGLRLLLGAVRVDRVVVFLQLGLARGNRVECLVDHHEILFDLLVALFADLDLAPDGRGFLLVADAIEAHPPILHLALFVVERALELAAAGLEVGALGAAGVEQLALCGELAFDSGEPLLEGLDRLCTLTELLVDDLQTHQLLDLIPQAFSSV